MNNEVVERKLTIVFLSNHSLNESQSKMMAGVFEAAQNKNVNVIHIGIKVFESEQSKTNQEFCQALELIKNLEQLDGLMFLGWCPGITANFDDFYNAFCYLPLFSLGSFYDKVPGMYVDGGSGIELMLNHLVLEHGYQKIVYVSPKKGDARDASYIKTMKNQGIYDEKLYIRPEEIGAENASSRAKQVVNLLLDERNIKPDAILSMYNDETAGIIYELKQRDILVPEDIAVVSYENGDESKFSTPAVTTIDYPWWKLGYAGCEKFIECIRNCSITSYYAKKYIPHDEIIKENSPKDENKLNYYTLPTRIIIRNSCGCLSGTSPNSQQTRSDESTLTLDKYNQEEIVALCNQIKLEINIQIDLEMLVKYFIEDYRYKNDQLFLREMNYQLDQLIVNNIQNIDEEDLEMQMHVFKKFLIPLISNDPKTNRWADALFQKLQVIIREKSINIIGRKLHQSDVLSYNFSEIGENLPGNYDMKALFNEVTKSLDKLKIKSCYIYLFQDQDSSHKNCRLAYAYANGAEIPIDKEFNNIVTDIVQVLHLENRCVLIQHLFVDDDFKGVVVFEPGPFDERIYYFMAVIISSALKGALTVKELVSYTEQLQKSKSEIKDALEKLKKTQAQLLQSEKMVTLGGLVAGVSHEINTPIGVGVMASSHLENVVSEMMKDFNSGKLTKSAFTKGFDTIHELSTIISENLKRAADLIGSFKRIAVDQSSEDIRLFNLKEYIETTLLSLKPKLKKTMHKIEINCDPDLSIYSYPGAFSQIITNFVMNSLLHAYDDHDKGKMVFDITKSDKKVYFTYSDDGKGMNQSTIERIFDPFYTTKRGNGGTGLGLFVVYNIVTQQLGGSIACEGAEGVGCKFRIIIDCE